MNKCLFLAVFAVLWSGCSRSEQAGVPNSIYEAFAVHPDSARFESLMLDLVESGDQTNTIFEQKKFGKSTSQKVDKNYLCVDTA